MSSLLRSLSFDARDPERLAQFWSRLLGRSIGPSGTSVVAGEGSGFDIRFTPESTPKVGLGRIHFDLTSRTAAEQDSTVASALSLGAEHLDVGQRPEEGHVVLADPEGNEFCVIEADNAFLADTDRIGALSCDGTLAVGLFWRDTLAWSLVWDEGEETAIQSPSGGTKIAWGGPPVAAKRGIERLRLDLTPTGGASVEEEIARLEALGARRLDVTVVAGEVMMADPDGNEFSIAE